MSRFTVCYEGRGTLDFRRFEKGSIKPHSDRVAVTLEFDSEVVVGWAEDFHRDDVTGAISFEIYFKEGYEQKVKDEKLTATCMLLKVKTSTPYADRHKMDRTIDDLMILTSGEIVEISFVDGPNAWGEYDEAL